jgi:hypothetical protein
MSVKPTHITIKAEGYHITVNGQSVYCNDQVEFTNSASGGTDIIGSWQEAELPNNMFQFELNNPWIGKPWGAVGPYADDNGWSNCRVGFSVGDVRVWKCGFSDGGDDGETDYEYARLTRLDDTDTKNFVLEIGVWDFDPNNIYCQN